MKKRSEFLEVLIAEIYSIPQKKKKTAIPFLWICLRSQILLWFSIVHHDWLCLMLLWDRRKACGGPHTVSRFSLAAMLWSVWQLFLFSSKLQTSFLKSPVYLRCSLNRFRRTFPGSARLFHIFSYQVTLVVGTDLWNSFTFEQVGIRCILQHVGWFPFSTRCETISSTDLLLYIDLYSQPVVIQR